MTPKTRWIIKIIVPIALIVVFLLSAYLFWVYLVNNCWDDSNDFSVNYREDVYITVPDSDLTLVVKHWFWLHSGGEKFYYVGLNEEHIFLGEEFIQEEYVSYFPFETGDYEVINNQNGTFTIRWKSLPPNAAPEHWNEITYDFPTK